MNIAFCYLTDGRNDPFMRRLSMASLRRHCGDVPVYTATVAGLYTSTCGEHVIDLINEWRQAFGNEKPGVIMPRPCNGFDALTNVLFCKLLLPLSPVLAQYDSIVFLDDDIEVQTDGFLHMPPLQSDADLGMVPDTVMNMGQYRPTIETLPSSVSRMWPKSTYHTAAVLLHRPSWTPGYLARVRVCYEENRRHRLPFPEEMAANLFMRVQSLPETYAMVPEAPSVGRVGRPVYEVRSSAAAHYGGPRKRAFIGEWAARYPEVKQ